MNALAPAPWSSDALPRRGSRAWQSLRKEVKQDLERANSRFRRLLSLGFEAVEMALRYFHAIDGALADVREAERVYGLGGARTGYSVAERIIGTLDHVGALNEAFKTSVRAVAYGKKLGEAVGRVAHYDQIPHTVRDRVLTQDFRLTTLMKLPAELPLSEVPALAVVCANRSLLERLRTGRVTRLGERALRHRFGFDDPTPVFRGYAAVGEALETTAKHVRGEAEAVLKKSGHQPI